jgi:hypothetical protein
MRAVGAAEKAPVCDVYGAYEALRGRDAKAWRLLLSDELHPNMDGHKLNAETIAQSITGRSVSLRDAGPLHPAIPKTLARLQAGEPVRVLAMPPFDKLIVPAFKEAAPSARVEVSAWPVAGRTLAQLAEDAKAVRGKPLDLVLVAVPASAKADSEERRIVAYSWVLNWSLSFGRQEWDVVGILPAVAKPDLTADEQQQNDFARHLIRAQDLTAIERKPGDMSSAEKILTEWLKGQMRR